MTQKKLFGNQSDPRCETCLYGKRSSDGASVLCRRGGVLPLSHHCRRFRYDPLRRTPNRAKPLEEFEATEFSLDDLSADWLETVTQPQPSAEDVHHDELMQKLRAYLDETASPNVEDILLLLNETPVTAADTEALLDEADKLPKETTDKDVPTTDEDIPAIEEVAPDTDDVVETPSDETPAESTGVWHADASLDIASDLERLTVDMVPSSTPAAFRNFDLKFAFEDDVNEDRDTVGMTDNFDEDALLTLPADDDSDEDTALRAEDLIFLSDSQLDDDSDDFDDALTMNADGTFAPLHKDS